MSAAWQNRLWQWIFLPDEKEGWSMGYQGTSDGVDFIIQIEDL